MKFRGFKNSWGKKSLLTFRSRYINQVDKEFQNKVRSQQKEPTKIDNQNLSEAIVVILVIAIILIWIL